MRRIPAIAFLIGFCTNLNAQNELREKIDPLLYPFYHGVASGDPLDDRVILWTRITDDTLSLDSIAIDWRIATDTGMTNIVNAGSGHATASKDWTYKIDATGLQPNTWYYYDFYALGRHSIRGRTKTAPTGDIDSIRFGVVSCSNWQHGYFSAYRHLQERNDVDCILHLGDYIYEYQVGGYSSNISDREHEPSNEIISLDDYRLRYSHYRLDEDLRSLHQQYPFINIWDDHESANDSYIDGAGNHDNGTEGLWSDRKSNATQAFHEWLPIRSPQQGTSRIYRAFKFGDLVNLPMLDTRLEARDEQVSATSSDVNSPSRTLLGTTQYNWLTDNLQNSTSRWNIIGQQVMMAPLEVFGVPVNADQWDGYAYERNELFNFLQSNSINNFVVLTGDIHTSWVNDLPHGSYNNSNCTGSVGVEFVVTSVTSSSFPFNVGSGVIQLANSHMQYINLSEKGYGVLDINKTRTQMDYYYINDVEDPQSSQYFAEGYYVNHLEKCANQALGFSTRSGTLPIQAPETPLSNPTNVSISFKDFVVFGAYPNPVYDNVTLQIYMPEQEELILSIVAIDGKLIYEASMNNLHSGVNYAQVDLSDLPIGTYSLILESKQHRVSKTLIKVQ